MQYIVSVEDITYHSWQLELLIESFKLHGLENQLIVGVATSNQPKIKDFTKNISKHKHIFYHDNFGQEHNCPYLNKCYAILIALEKEFIKQPFTVIEPDMVLVNPMPVPKEQIAFSIDWQFTLNYVETNGIQVTKYIQDLVKERNLSDKELWLPIGSVYTFKDVYKDIFSRVIHWTNKLNELTPDKKRDTAKTAWIMAMIDYYGIVSFNPEPLYEITLLDQNVNCNFIHYNHGLPPVWNKRMYKYLPPYGLCMGNETPFHTLLEHNPTPATNYLQKIVKQYMMN